MKRSYAVFAVMLASLAFAAPAPDAGNKFLELQPKANHKLKESFHGGAFPQNTLAELPQGKQKLDGINFNIGEKLIQLANAEMKDSFPEKVEGIKVGAKFTKLHILHGTGYVVDADTVIGKYIIHFDDKTDAEIEVVYGKDVSDWWRLEGHAEPSRGKVAWKGSNPDAKERAASLWLFHITWENPKPDKKVVSIDCVSTLTHAAPFVIAMTTEDK